MAKRKRSCILYSERRILADILEKQIKMCGVECSVLNVLTFLNSKKLLNADAVAAFVNKGGVKPDCENNPGFKTMGDIIQVRYYPDGVVEVKTIKQKRGRPQNI